MVTARAARRGFTLIEVAVVLVSIALLAAIAIPSYSAFMDGTDVRAARAEAELLVKNAAGVSSQDGYTYYCPPMAEGDTTPFWQALEDVDNEQGESPYAAPYDTWVDYLGVTEQGWGVVQVIGVRWTHYFVLDMCTGDLYDAYADPGNGDVPLSIQYPDTDFNPFVPEDSLSPIVFGGDGGGLTFSVAGDLPPGIELDPDTGVLTGVPDWNFTATQVEGTGEGGCALTAMTTVKCWGSAVRWPRPRTVAISDVPAPQSTGTALPLTGVQKIDVSYAGFGCALTLSGNVLCWGANGSGQLGSGAVSTQEYSPKYVVDVGQPAGGSPLTGISDISVGSSNACAVRSSGQTVCWGSGASGALGNGLAVNSSSPVTVIAPGEVVGGAPLTGVESVSVAEGSGSVCALLVSTKVVCWGRNPAGEVGIGQTTSINATPQGFVNPSYVVGVGEGFGGEPLTGATAIEVGWQAACAVLLTGRVACWGANGFLELMPPNLTSIPSPVLVSNGEGYLENVEGIRLSTWQNTWCVLFTSKSVSCWTAYENPLTPLPAGWPVNASYYVQDPLNVAEGQTALIDGEVFDPHAGLSGVEQLGKNCALRTQGRIFCWETFDSGLASWFSRAYDTTSIALVTSYYPLHISRSGPQRGFPATVTITATAPDGTTASTTVTLTVE